MRLARAAAEQIAEQRAEADEAGIDPIMLQHRLEAAAARIELAIDTMGVIERERTLRREFRIAARQSERGEIDAAAGRAPVLEILRRASAADRRPSASPCPALKYRSGCRGRAA